MALDSVSDLKLSTLMDGNIGSMLAKVRQAFFGCLPRWFGRWLASRHPDLVVAPQGDRAQLFRDVIGERQPVGALVAHAPDMKPVLDVAETRSWRRIILELPSALILTRRLVLPAQVRGNLRRVVAYELDRLTPFAPTEVFFDARVVAGLSGGTTIDVELALCPRGQVTTWVDQLRAVKRPPSQITWPGAWAEANLLPPDEQPRPRRLAWIISGLLLLLVVGLTVTVLLTPLWQRAHEQDRLAQELTRMAAQAEEVSELREALERARVGSLAVLEHKRDYPRMTGLLLELTELLPDGTWVQTLNYRDGAVDIRGESSQATALIGVLERGPGISNVTFRSPVMQVSASGSERFHIAFDYKTVAVQ
ncbi:MAG: PilN domain-containing protein [Chromatiaceae bacterium]|nr:PilN domain-containing protein [Chromatiaceae bacterium]